MRGLARKIGWRRVAGVAGFTAAGLYVAGQAGFSLAFCFMPLESHDLLTDGFPIFAMLLPLLLTRVPLAMLAIAALAACVRGADRESLRRLAGGVAILLGALALLALLLNLSLFIFTFSTSIPIPYVGLVGIAILARSILLVLVSAAAAVTLVRWPGVSAAACFGVVALAVWSMAWHPVPNNPDYLAFLDSMEEAWSLENMPVEEDVLLESGGVTDTLTDDVVTVAGEIHVHPNFSTLLVYAAAGLLARQWRRVRAAGEAARTAEA